jgi:hypothetical protein
MSSQKKRVGSHMFVFPELQVINLRYDPQRDICEKCGKYHIKVIRCLIEDLKTNFVGYMRFPAHCVADIYKHGNLFIRIEYDKRINLMEFGSEVNRDIAYDFLINNPLS